MLTRHVGVEIDVILTEYLQTHIDTLHNLKSVEHLKKLEFNLSSS